jgi:hypothetical protein
MSYTLAQHSYRRISDAPMVGRRVVADADRCDI